MRLAMRLLILASHRFNEACQRLHLSLQPHAIALFPVVHARAAHQLERDVAIGLVLHDAVNVVGRSRNPVHHMRYPPCRLNIRSIPNEYLCRDFRLRGLRGNELTRPQWRDLGPYRLHVSP